ncbi:MAG TPA: hypothetical protein VJ725_13060, partial [Thermoanaerobaculia bacterium]|nr:hypothetical protein [Thermoanaerobaculia bacterium]
MQRQKPHSQAQAGLIQQRLLTPAAEQLVPSVDSQLTYPVKLQNVQASVLAGGNDARRIPTRAIRSNDFLFTSFSFPLSNLEDRFRARQSIAVASVREGAGLKRNGTRR